MIRSWLKDWESSLAIMGAALIVLVLRKFTSWSWLPIVITAAAVFCATAFVSGFVGGLLDARRADPGVPTLWAMVKYILWRR